MKKSTKRPDLKKRLDVVQSAPEPDVNVNVTLPADIYRAIEAVASVPVGVWIAQMLSEAVASDMPDEGGAGEDSDVEADTD